MTQVLLCGAAIVTLSMGIRHGFGLWLQPITMERGWTRETFAFALAVQNLAWGIAGPFAGALADRFGAFKVLLGSALLYAAGLILMAPATSGLAFTGSAGILIGMAQAGCTYAVIYGVVSRNVPAERRSWAMGVTAAAGSFGQFLMVPVASGLIGAFGWQEAGTRYMHEYRATLAAHTRADIVIKNDDAVVQSVITPQCFGTCLVGISDFAVVVAVRWRIAPAVVELKRF